MKLNFHINVPYERQLKLAGATILTYLITTGTFYQGNFNELKQRQNESQITQKLNQENLCELNKGGK